MMASFLPDEARADEMASARDLIGKGVQQCSLGA